jgi:hypothetical protein
MDKLQTQKKQLEEKHKIISDALEKAKRERRTNLIPDLMGEEMDLKDEIAELELRIKQQRSVNQMESLGMLKGGRRTRRTRRTRRNRKQRKTRNRKTRRQ